MPAGGSSSPSADLPDVPLTVRSLELRGAGGETATVRLSDGSSFIAPAEVLAAEGLATGQELDPQRLAAVRRRGEAVLARSRALALLSRAAHTRRALARKLRARGFTDEAVRAAVARMAELGYLDDRAFALDWARARVAGKAEGWKAVCRGLVARGVPRTLAGEVADEVCTDEAEMEMARRVGFGLAPRTAAARLQARGFRARTIARLLRELRGRRGAGD